MKLSLMLDYSLADDGLRLAYFTTIILLWYGDINILNFQLILKSLLMDC